MNYLTQKWHSILSLSLLLFSSNLSLIWGQEGKSAPTVPFFPEATLEYQAKMWSLFAMENLLLKEDGTKAMMSDNIDPILRASLRLKS